MNYPAAEGGGILSGAQRAEAHRLSQAEKGFGDSLCAKCRMSTIVRRSMSNDPVIRCEIFGRVPSDIAECNRFVDKKSQLLHEMESIAEIIDSRPMPGQHL